MTDRHVDPLHVGSHRSGTLTLPHGGPGCNALDSSSLADERHFRTLRHEIRFPEPASHGAKPDSGQPSRQNVEAWISNPNVWTGRREFRVSSFGFRVSSFGVWSLERRYV